MHVHLNKCASCQVSWSAFCPRRPMASQLRPTACLAMMHSQTCRSSIAAAAIGRYSLSGKQRRTSCLHCAVYYCVQDNAVKRQLDCSQTAVQYYAVQYYDSLGFPIWHMLYRGGSACACLPESHVAQHSRSWQSPG